MNESTLSTNSRISSPLHPQPDTPALDPTPVFRDGLPHSDSRLQIHHSSFIIRVRTRRELLAALKSDQKGGSSCIGFRVTASPSIQTGEDTFSSSIRFEWYNRAVLSAQYFIDVLKPRVEMVRRFTFALTVAVSLFGSTLGQETPKAVLVDEFGFLQCGDLLARLDAFMVELQNNPGDRGYVLISEAKRNPKAFQRIVEASFFTRRFDRERISIVLVGKEMGSEGQFWRVPLGAEAPAFKPIARSEPDLTKAFRYGGEDSDTICPTFSPDLFAKLILDNPGSMARVVIAGPTVSSRLQMAKGVREMFESYTKLPADRISFYYVHRPKDWMSGIEYWFIPAKRR